MAKTAEITGILEFIADIDGEKDCLMAQDKDKTHENKYWFNIDVPKGHGFQAGERVKVTIEQI